MMFNNLLCSYPPSMIIATIPYANIYPLILELAKDPKDVTFPFRCYKKEKMGSRGIE